MQLVEIGKQMISETLENKFYCICISHNNYSQIVSCFLDSKTFSDFKILVY